MADRKAKLSRLVPGYFSRRMPKRSESHLLGGSHANGKIEARRVTTQDHVTFELSTGLSLPDDGEGWCTIDSIAPLPVGIHNVMLGLDRKMRLRFAKLDRAEKDALIFVADFYPANPL